MQLCFLSKRQPNTQTAACPECVGRGLPLPLGPSQACMGNGWGDEVPDPLSAPSPLVHSTVVWLGPRGLAPPAPQFGARFLRWTKGRRAALRNSALEGELLNSIRIPFGETAAEGNWCCGYLLLALYKTIFSDKRKDRSVWSSGRGKITP